VPWPLDQPEGPADGSWKANQGQDWSTSPTGLREPGDYVSGSRESFRVEQVDLPDVLFGAGAEHRQRPPQLLQPGDTVEVERLGLLRNTVVGNHRQSAVAVTRGDSSGNIR
jgi:hypothetical protein